MNFLSIGHSSLQVDQFLGLLKTHGVTMIADVRSVPFSRRFPWFSSRALADRLQSKGISYMMVGDTLGGRPTNPALYRDGVADYEAMARTADFYAGIDRVVREMAHHRVCLMCAEREPLDCHRCLLVEPLAGGAQFYRRPYPGRRLARAEFGDRRPPPRRPAARSRRRPVRRPRIAPCRGLSPPRSPDRRPAVGPGPARPDAPGHVLVLSHVVLAPFWAFITS